MATLTLQRIQCLSLPVKVSMHLIKSPQSWPWPWILKVKYEICYISVKNGLITTKRKENITIKLWASNVTIGFDLGHALDLEFSRPNMKFAISQPKMARLPRIEKQTYRLKSMPQMWPSGLTLAMKLTLNLQGQIWNLLYLSQIWSDYHETKNKHIDWTLGLTFDHRVWPWPWTWSCIFKVKYGLCYILTESGPKVRCKLPDSDRGDFRCRRAVYSCSWKEEYWWALCFNDNLQITEADNMSKSSTVSRLPGW